MANEVPELFDPVKAGLALVRAGKRGAETFLIERIADELDERMLAVLREFPEALDFGSPSAMIADRLARPGRRVTRLADEAALASFEAERPEQRFDLIASMGLFHRINDLPGLMLRLRRLLRPDGLLIAAFPGGDSLMELRASLLQAESEMTGHAAMRIAPMIDTRAAGQLLQRAGLALPVADRSAFTIRYANLMRLVSDLRSMGQGGAILRRPACTPQLTRAVFLRAAEIYARDHADADGKLRATIEIIWISGWAPHDSQQKPLKPGSAKTRLADALDAIRAGEGPQGEGAKGDGA